MANLRERQKAEESERLAAFRADLKSLMEKHGANLDVHMEGDTYGIEESYVAVSLKPMPGGHITLCTESVQLFEDD
jgi:hypothetical protein